MRPFAIALIVLAQTPTLTAQDPDRERREERRVQKLLTELESGDPPRIARGAFDAGENGLKKTIPGLRKALRELAKMDDNAALQPRAAVLDALVRLGGKAQAKDLDQCLGKYVLPTTMILMSRAPEEYEDQLTEVFKNNADDRTQFCWLAAGNMLTKMRSKKFVRLLLDRMRVVVNIKVIRPGDDLTVRVRTHIGLGGSASSTRYFYLNKFPPFGLYELGSTQKKGDLSITKGSVPIFGRRLLPNQRNKIRLRSSFRHIDFTGRNLEWLANLLRTEVKKLPMSANVDDTIFYSDNKSYARDIGRIRDKVRGSHRALANRLRVAGLLTANAKIRASVNVRIFVHDRRPSDKPPLPEIESVEIHGQTRKKK
jgi:hypothetical protein